jgi:hypothetical protein
MVLLLPRLPSIAAERILDGFIEGFATGSFAFDSQNLPASARFAPTGGSRISPSQLNEFRQGVVTIAAQFGFGEQGPSRDFARFDSRLGAWLAESMIFASGEALRDDVWSFIGVAVAPDVVQWRFGFARERYLGGVRNTFQRLWLRGRTLDRGQGAANRWDLLNTLTEDAFVQIIERPSLGGDPVLARAIAEAWLRAAHRFGKGRMEPVMRRATLKVRIQNEIQSLASLGDDALAEYLDSVFEAAASSLNIRAAGVWGNVEEVGI